MSHEDYTAEARLRIGQALNAIREKRGIGVNELARLSEQSTTIVHKVLKGGNYEINGFLKVCRVLQVHMELSAMSADNNIWTMTGQGPAGGN